MSISDDLAAALDGRELTDEQGQISEEDTSDQDTATDEENTDNELATAEKSDESEAEGAEPSEDEEENDDSELAEDESGKRYVPEKRFKGVYAKYKEAERKAQEREEQLQQLTEGLLKDKPSNGEKAKPTYTPEKADILELKMTLPEFNPDDENYNSTLDGLGYRIWKSSFEDGKPTMSLLDAGKQALQTAKEISKKQVEAKQSARSEKSVRSDQGITSRVVSRKDQSVNPEKMSLEQMEEYLRETGQW